jgi:hypothetical protein
MRPSATGVSGHVCGLQLLVYAAMYAAFSYWCMRSLATSVCRSEARLVYAAFSYYCMRPLATSVCGLKLRVYAALSY